MRKICQRRPCSDRCPNNPRARKLKWMSFRFDVALERYTDGALSSSKHLTSAIFCPWIFKGSRLKNMGSDEVVSRLLHIPSTVLRALGCVDINSVPERSARAPSLNRSLVLRILLFHGLTHSAEILSLNRSLVSMIAHFKMPNPWNQLRQQQPGAKVETMWSYRRSRCQKRLMTYFFLENPQTGPEISVQLKGEKIFPKLGNSGRLLTWNPQKNGRGVELLIFSCYVRATDASMLNSLSRIWARQPSNDSSPMTEGSYLAHELLR